jgi:hypothetical protein
MYARLMRDIPTLDSQLRLAATIILQGTDSMDPSHSDMLARAGDLR